MLLSTNFIPVPAKGALLHRGKDEIEKRHQEEGILVTYDTVVNYFLQTYAAVNVITKAKAETVNFKQPASRTTVCYLQVLCEIVFRFGGVYDESLLKRILIERLHASIRYSMYTYWGAQ